MAEISYRRHRFPPVIIQHAVSLYLRFTLSYRDVEELLAERGLDISYETVRCWVLKFGPVIARRLRRCRRRPSNRWHLDEMVVRIAGERMYLWRAVDQEGEFLDLLIQPRRDKRAAARPMRKLLSINPSFRRCSRLVRLPQHDPLPQQMTIKEVAECFGVNRATIYRSLGLGSYA